MRRKKITGEKPPPIFKGFTAEQRCALAAAWPSRMSEIKRVTLGDFLERTERMLLSHLNPAIPESPLSAKEWRNELASMAQHARALRLSIERLPPRQQFMLSAAAEARITACGLSFLRAGGSPGAVRYGEIVARDAFLPLLSALAAHLEAIQKMEMLRTLKAGASKALEYGVLVALADLHLDTLGKVSPSENGIFVRFLKTLGPMIGISLGPDLLKTVLADYPQE